MEWLRVLGTLAFIGTRRYSDLHDSPELQWRINLSEALDWNFTAMNQSDPGDLVPYMLYRVGCVPPLIRAPCGSISIQLIH